VQNSDGLCSYISVLQGMTGHIQLRRPGAAQRDQALTSALDNLSPSSESPLQSGICQSMNRTIPFSPMQCSASIVANNSEGITRCWLEKSRPRAVILVRTRNDCLQTQGKLGGGWAVPILFSGHPEFQRHQKGIMSHGSANVDAENG
jgi:hypothetical protein